MLGTLATLVHRGNGALKLAAAGGQVPGGACTMFLFLLGCDKIHVPAVIGPTDAAIARCLLCACCNCQPRASKRTVVCVTQTGRSRTGMAWAYSPSRFPSLSTVAGLSLAFRTGSGQSRASCSRFTAFDEDAFEL
jgi:hypothetical protein